MGYNNAKGLGLEPHVRDAAACAVAQCIWCTHVHAAGRARGIGDYQNNRSKSHWASKLLQFEHGLSLECAHRGPLHVPKQLYLQLNDVLSQFIFRNIAAVLHLRNKARDGSKRLCRREQPYIDAALRDA